MRFMVQFERYNVFRSLFQYVHLVAVQNTEGEPLKGPPLEALRVFVVCYSLQLTPHAPPQHPPPLSHDEAEDAEPPFITAAAGMLMRRVCFVEPHDGHTTSSAISRVLW